MARSTEARLRKMVTVYRRLLSDFHVAEPPVARSACALYRCPAQFGGLSNWLDRRTVDLDSSLWEYRLT